MPCVHIGPCLRTKELRSLTPLEYKEWWKGEKNGVFFVKHQWKKVIWKKEYYLKFHQWDAIVNNSNLSSFSSLPRPTWTVLERRHCWKVSVLLEFLGCKGFLESLESELDDTSNACNGEFYSRLLGSKYCRCGRLCNIIAWQLQCDL
jgi:hypothetical protein